MRTVTYNMEDFFRACVSRYRELTGVQYMRHAATPFLHETAAPDFTYEAAGLDPPAEADPEGAYRDLSTASKAPPGTSGSRSVAASPVTSGCGDADKAEHAIPQQLKPYAAKVLMKVLYAARYARPDRGAGFKRFSICPSMN